MDVSHPFPLSIRPANQKIRIAVLRLLFLAEAIHLAHQSGYLDVLGLW